MVVEAIVAPDVPPKRIEILESTTDTDGRFTLPSWGPVTVKPLTAIDDDSPIITIFKHGYQPVTLRNERQHGKLFLASKWDGTVVKLRPFGDTAIQRRSRVVTVMYDGLVAGATPEDEHHDWINYPRITAEVCDESRFLKGKTAQLPIVPRGTQLTNPPVSDDLRRRCEDAS
jgi:hypothetical protein